MQLMRRASYVAVRRDAEPLMIAEDTSISVLFSGRSDSTNAAPLAPKRLVLQDSHWRGHYRCSGRGSFPTEVEVSQQAKRVKADWRFST